MGTYKLAGTLKFKDASGNVYELTPMVPAASVVVYEDEQTTVGLQEKLERLQAELDAMKGINLGCTPEDGRVRQDCNPWEFDYFILYNTANDVAPLVFNDLIYDSQNETFTAVHYHGIEQIATSDRQAKSILYFYKTDNEEWAMEYSYMSTDDHESNPDYYRVYGFKYPKRGA